MQKQNPPSSLCCPLPTTFAPAFSLTIIQLLILRKCHRHLRFALAFAFAPAPSSIILSASA